MYNVTAIEPFKSRNKVFINEELAFVLYKGDLKKFHIEIGQDITTENYTEILELLYSRGKERALYILGDTYKTEKQIKDKLKKGFYPEEIIERIMNFLKEYNFVDDVQYTHMYIEYKSESRSRRRIVQDLYLKGVSKEVISAVFEEMDFSDCNSLNKTINKRISKYNMSDKKDIQKFYNYLVGKGYLYSDVKSALEHYIDD